MVKTVACSRPSQKEGIGPCTRHPGDEHGSGEGKGVQPEDEDFAGLPESAAGIVDQYKTRAAQEEHSVSIRCWAGVRWTSGSISGESIRGRAISPAAESAIARL
jgi:hypothetical protein